jgi:hypothetical protein
MSASGFAGLVLCLGLIQVVDPPNAAELVARLGAPRYADREAAGEALVKLGRAALPELAKARESRDPELKRRAVILAARIEAAGILEPTRVRLDVRDRPLAEAVEAIARDSGQGLRPGTVNGSARPAPGWPDVRVTLVADEPVPFWKAVDRLCAAGGLQRVYPPAADGPFPFRSPFELTLVPGKARPPASDTGAFRVELLRIRHLRERDYANRRFATSPVSPKGAATRDPETGALERASYSAELLVSAEPRLRIIGVGAVDHPEVVDQRGRSLWKGPTAEEEEARLRLWQANPHLDPRLHPGLRFGSGWRTSTRTWQVAVPLSYPSPRAHRIARLHGAIPVVAVTRRPAPLVINLKGAAGNGFSSGATRIHVHEFKAEPGQPPTVDITLETSPVGEGQTLVVYDPQGRRLAVNPSIDLMQLRLEVLDSRGECLFWQYTRPPSERTHGRMAIVIHGRNGRQVQEQDRMDGLRLRFWELIGAATDLPFAFNDVPTP